MISISIASSGQSKLACLECALFRPLEPTSTFTKPDISRLKLE